MRNERLRIGRVKPLKSLWTLNQSFRRFVRYQGLEADFVSPFSRMARLRRFRPERRSLARRIEAAGYSAALGGRPRRADMASFRSKWAA